MKKFIMCLAMVVILCGQAFAIDTWTFKVQEITKPNLTEFSVRFEIVLNGSSYANDMITVQGIELDGMTLTQRKAYLASKVKARIAPYMAVYNTYVGLNEVVGQEFSAK